MLLLASAGQAYAQAEISLFGAAQALRVLDQRSAETIAEDVMDGNLAGAGIRFTWWQHENLGFSLDYSINNVEAGLGAVGWEPVPRLSLRAVRRWQDLPEGLSPYVGAGVGFSGAIGEGVIGDDLSFLTGLARADVHWAAGASISIADDMSLFGEISRSSHLTRTGGQTDGQASHVDFGVTFGF